MNQLPSRTLSILVENRFGALFSITALFSARGYNIESLTVFPDEADPGLSRLTMVARCGPGVSEQIIKQLNKLVDVVQVDDITQ
jgi:acetolactate synthase-1/3 small subunit